MTLRKALLEGFLLLVFSTCFVLTYASSQSLLVSPPNDGFWIVDTTGQLDSRTLEWAQESLQNFHLKTSHSLGILLVQSLGGESIEEFSIRQASHWKLGRKGADDGILFVLALDERRLRLEVGRGLEDSLTDAKSSRVINELVIPSIRSKGLSHGIAAGIIEIVGLYEKDLALSLQAGWTSLSVPITQYDVGSEPSIVTHAGNTNQVALENRHWFLIGSIVAAFIFLALCMPTMFQPLWMLTANAGLILFVVYRLCKDAGPYPYYLISIGLSLVLIIGFRILVHKTKWGQRLLSKKSSGNGVSNSGSSSSSSSSSSSRGGSYGGGGASGRW